MKTRRWKGKSLKAQYVEQQIALLRNVCEKYSKHPDRLSYRDAQEIFIALESDTTYQHWEGDQKVAGKDTYPERRAIKDFLKSKGDPEADKIGVGKPSGYAHYADISAPKATVYAMLDWIKTQDVKVYSADMLMYHNALRLTATLEAKIENFKRGEFFDKITVLEKFRETKTFKVVKEVGDILHERIGDRKEGRIFEGLTEDAMSTLNREALLKFMPELEPRIEMPNHVFRHFCIQELLRVTKRNTAAVAAIVQCSEQSLKESYGAAPKEEVEQWENTILPLLSR